MTPLSSQQQQLLFDYSFGLTSERETAQARELLSSNPQAEELYRSFQSTLAPLDTVELEACPHELTERLFSRLKETLPADASEEKLHDLLAAEQSAPRRIRIPLWRNWTEVAAAAATVLLFISVLFPAVGYMRQRHWQTRCGTQFASIYSGYQNYMADHDMRMPSMPISAGSPWWKVGYQGAENHSNTRQVWLVVQQGYVQPDKFLCPGRREEHPLSFDGFNVRNFNDFPSPAYIQFSVRIACPTSNARGMMQKMVLMADRNPLSEELPSDHSTSLKLQLCEALLKANSINHNDRGQNVLLYDGSVEFTRHRYASISEDDIYILRDMSCDTQLSGCELPSCDADIFLAP